MQLQRITECKMHSEHRSELNEWDVQYGHVDAGYMPLYFLSNGLLRSARAAKETAYTVYPRSSSSSSSSLSPSWCGDTEGTWRCLILIFSSGCVGDVGLCTELSPEAESSSTRRFGRKPSLAGTSASVGGDRSWRQIETHQDQSCPASRDVRSGSRGWLCHCCCCCVAARSSRSPHVVKGAARPRRRRARRATSGPAYWHRRRQHAGRVCLLACLRGAGSC